MRAKAIVSVLLEVIKSNTVEESLRMVGYTQLKYICENTAKYSGGKYLPLEYNDIVNPKPVDKRTADEVVNDIVEQAGLTLI